MKEKVSLENRTMNRYHLNLVNWCQVVQLYIVLDERYLIYNRLDSLVFQPVRIVVI